MFPSDADGKILFSDVDYVDTWKALEKCVAKGLTKSIGLSNFNKKQIERLLSVASVKPVINQVKFYTKQMTVSITNASHNQLIIELIFNY